MPTYFRSQRFLRDYDGLSEQQKARFREAVKKFVADLDAGRPGRPSLGIEQLKSAPGIYEFHFEGNGRATFSFGAPPAEHAGEIHIDWRRVGDHDVYNSP